MSNTNPILEPLLHVLDPISLILNQNSNLDQLYPLKFTSSDSYIMERGRNYEAYAELREKRLLTRCLMQVQEEGFEIESSKVVNPTRKLVNFQDDLAYERKGSLEQEEIFDFEPQKVVASTKKHVKFQGELKGSMEKEENFEIKPQKLVASTRKEVKFQGGRKGSSVVAQSVPDFSAVLRKENRKPLNSLPSVMEMMTPPSKSSFSKDNNGVLSSSRGSRSENAGEKKKKGGVLMGRKSYASFDELRSFSSATATAINGEGRGRRNSRVMGKTVSGHRQF